MTAKGYIDRLEAEREELDIKIEKLERAIGTSNFKSASRRNQALQVRQLSVMNDYRSILGDRIRLNVSTFRKKGNTSV